MAPVQKMAKEDFKKQIDIVYSLLSMLNSDAPMNANSFKLLGSNGATSTRKEVKVNGKVLEAFMRLTFEEKYRRSICNLDGLHAIAAILIDCTSKLEVKVLSDSTTKSLKHTCMALTNLTYGDVQNKNTVCSIEGFVPSLVKLLDKSGEDLRKVVAGLVRNISWKADAASKNVLRESGVVFALLKCSMETERESTLKCLLNALWNVSSHSAENKADICDYPHSLEFIVSLLTQSETIVENGGGILKNISSHIAVTDHCRQVLRKHKCLEILLSHLQSSNMVVVANACGTLWNLSARCSEDQQSLWKLGAVGLLGNLVNSEDKAISLGSSAALKNLLLFKTNSSSLFSSCSSSPSDDKNKESAYWSEGKRFKEKEASADSSASSTFQTSNFNKTFMPDLPEANHNLANNGSQPSTQQTNNLQPYNHQGADMLYESDMKVDNQYYGFDESADEMIDFSTKYKEICFGSSTDQLLDSTKQLYSPSEHPKLYCTEDTPENYSEINAPSFNINELETSFGLTATTHSNTKLYDKPQKTILVNHRSSGSSENSSNPNSGQKSVTFSEINQTPMMFSRTTSLGSVNSYEAPSVHSSVASVYSHRPSGVVSPSELPDSPGDTMPPSPFVPEETLTHKKPVQNDAAFGVRETEEDEERAEAANDSDFSDNENDNEELLEEVIQAAMPGPSKSSKDLRQFGMGEVAKSLYEDDVPKCYRSEGTPLIFSRNDSLSSLGSKESPQRPSNTYALSSLHPKVKKFIDKHDQYFKLQPAIPVPNNLTSTPSAKTIPILEDQLLKYEVEGTPDKVPPLKFDEVQEVVNTVFNCLTISPPPSSANLHRPVDPLMQLSQAPNTNNSCLTPQSLQPTTSHASLSYSQQPLKHQQQQLQPKQPHKDSKQQYQELIHQKDFKQPLQQSKLQLPQHLQQQSKPKIPQVLQQHQHTLQKLQHPHQNSQQQSQRLKHLQQQPHHSKSPQQQHPQPSIPQHSQQQQLQQLKPSQLQQQQHQTSNLNDSDSSVSFDSSDIETSPLDNRLLQECIVSGLPKHKRRRHKRMLFDYEKLRGENSKADASMHQSTSPKNHDGLKSHDVSRVGYIEEDEYTFSGPSTEANNTVIYRGLLLSDGTYEDPDQLGRVDDGGGEKEGGGGEINDELEKRDYEKKDKFDGNEKNVDKGGGNVSGKEEHSSELGDLSSVKVDDGGRTTSGTRHVEKQDGGIGGVVVECGGGGDDDVGAEIDSSSGRRGVVGGKKEVEFLETGVIMVSKDTENGTDNEAVKEGAIATNGYMDGAAGGDAVENSGGSLSSHRRGSEGKSVGSKSSDELNVEVEALSSFEPSLNLSDVSGTKNTEITSGHNFYVTGLFGAEDVPFESGDETLNGPLEHCTDGVVAARNGGFSCSHLDSSSLGSEGKYQGFIDDSCHTGKEFELNNILSEFYEKTYNKETEESRYQFRVHSPITTSISEGDIKNVRTNAWNERLLKDKNHSKSKIFNFFKKALKKKKKT